MLKAISGLQEDNSSHFKNLTESLFTAKKQKINDARDGERYVKKQKVQAELDRIAAEDAEKLAEKQLKNRKFLKASERFAQQPTIDIDTYAGKLKVLRDVQ